MTRTQSITTSRRGPLVFLSLNRPEVHNALNLEMIRSLTAQIIRFSEDEKTRMILLQANGKNFSAGADLKWMAEGQGQTAEQLEKESMELARLFHSIYQSGKLILVATRGKVLGGANGLVAAADIVLAEETARFAFTEVKLGLVPATIAPYVVRKIGRSRAGELMLSGRFFDAREAFNLGLVHHLIEEGSMDKQAQLLVNELLSSGPEAIRGIKELLRNPDLETVSEKLIGSTAELIAHYRTSAEGQEGIKAFFEKRKPGWYEPE